jgi:hypothetical protein
MSARFQIEDELHSEIMGDEHASFEAALAGVRRLASIPWGEEPNVAPCQGWQTCGRHYQIVELGDGAGELNRTPIVDITAEGVKWEYEER